MGRLILSEDATVEVDGRSCFLKKGTAVRVRKHENCFKVDEDFQINTHRGKMLIESGNIVYIRNVGTHKALSEAKFVSDGKSYAIENGDKFYVIDEGFWSGFKEGFMGGTKEKSEVVARIGSAASDIVEMIEEMHNSFEAENPGKDSPYASMKSSTAYHTLHLISQNAGNPRAIRKLMIMKKIDDPIQAIDELEKAAYDVGADELGDFIGEIAPKGGVARQLSKFWNSISGQKGGANLKRVRAEIATDAEGKKYALVGSKLTGPLNIDAESGKPSKAEGYQSWKFVGGKTFEGVDGKKIEIVKRELEKMQAPVAASTLPEVTPDAPAQEQKKEAAPAQKKAVPVVAMGQKVKNEIWRRFQEMRKADNSQTDQQICVNIAKQSPQDEIEKYGLKPIAAAIVRVVREKLLNAEPPKEETSAGDTAWNKFVAVWKENKPKTISDTFDLMASVAQEYDSPQKILGFLKDKYRKAAQQ